MLIGFFGMRRSLVKLTRVSEKTKDILEGNITEQIDIKATGDNEVSHIIQAFNEIVNKLEVNIVELKRSKSLLQEVLAKVAKGISSSENIDNFLDLILETTVNALDAKSGLLLLSEQETKELIVKSSFGQGAGAYARDKRIVMEETVGWVVQRAKPLLIPRLHKAVTAEPVSDAELPFQPPLICTPLIFQNRVIGAISISGKASGTNFEEDELIILSDLASQIGLAIVNAKLNADAQKTYLETITALALAVEARDPYSRGHSDRVSKYSEKVARALGLSDERVQRIKEAAQLHDVGKIGISDEILRKPDMLNQYETEIMHQHPVIGEGIIVPLHGFSDLRDPIRHHHEWLNGEGYPDRLKGEAICLEARILSVADAFDAMTTDRPYRKGADFSVAKEELKRYKGVRYDEKIVDAFISCI